MATRPERIFVLVNPDGSVAVAYGQEYDAQQYLVKNPASDATIVPTYYIANAEWRLADSAG